MPSALLFGYNVAIFTRSSRKRGMQHALKELGVLRSMRVMAVPAIHDRRIDIDMRFAKRCALRIVAFPTQVLNGLVHQRCLR